MPRLFRRSFRKLQCESLESRTLLAGDLAGAFGDRAALVADLNTTLTSFEVKSDIEFAGQTYVLARNEDHTELWKTDGTRNGSERIAELPGEFIGPTLEANQRLYFVVGTFTPGMDGFAGNGSTQLWSTDATTEDFRQEFTIEHDGWQTVHLELVNETLLVSVSWFGELDGSYNGMLFSNSSGEFAAYQRTGGIVFWQRHGDEVYYEEDLEWLNSGDHDFAMKRTNPLTRETNVVRVTHNPFSNPTVKLFEDIPEFEVETEEVENRADWSSEKIQEVFGAKFRTRPIYVRGSLASSRGVIFEARTFPGGFLGITDGSSSGTRKLSSVVSLPTNGRFQHLGDGAYFVLSSSGLKEVNLEESSDSAISSDLRTVISTDGTPDGTTVSTLGDEEFLMHPAGQLSDQRLYTTRCGSLLAVDEQQTVTHLIDLDGCDRDTGMVEVAVSQDRAWYLHHRLGRSNTFWVTDGTTEGTRKIGESIVDSVKSVGRDAFYFRDNILFRWNHGATTPTDLVELPEFGSFQSDLATLNDRVVFFDNHLRLWSTDGTTAGTSVLKQFPSPTDPDDWNWVRTQFIEANGRLFFAAYDRDHGVELWSTDGTAQGTTLAVDINPGLASSYPRELVVFDQQVIFAANDGIHGSELWKVDLVEAIDSISGDTDGDGFVNFTDFLVLANNFGSETDAGDRDGDFDGDGLVSFKDFLVLANNFGSQA